MYIVVYNNKDHSVMGIYNCLGAYYLVMLVDKYLDTVTLTQHCIGKLYTYM